MNRRQVTLADLAQELGISTATVSRALKDYPDISNETKERVLALARQWNYRPNSMAAGLRKQESRVIGVIIPEIVNHFFSSVIKGIMQTAYDADYRVMLCQSDESYEKEVADANALFASRVDGILVSLAHETVALDHLYEFQHAGVPIVFFDKVPLEEKNNISKVVVDDYQGAYNVVSHLIEQGAKRIAHFRGPMEAYTSRNRFLGYQAALEANGIPLDTDLVYDCSKITLEEGVSFVHDLVDKGVAFDAIFSITDSVGIGALLGLQEKGLNVPEDVMLAGFSDWKMSSVVQPSLTTVAQPSLEMGRLAMELLLREIQASKDEVEPVYETIVLKTELKVRDSSQRITEKAH
ncbi:MAG: LacI family DNA-binding transcriptional regulator [Bacteroidota bacterium]